MTLSGYYTFVTALEENTKFNLKKFLTKYGYPNKVADAVWNWYTLKEVKKDPTLLTPSKANCVYRNGTDNTLSPRTQK